MKKKKKKTHNLATTNLPLPPLNHNHKHSTVTVTRLSPKSSHWSSTQNLNPNQNPISDAIHDLGATHNVNPNHLNQPIEATTHNFNPTHYPNQNPITNPKPTKSTKTGAWGGKIGSKLWRMRRRDQWRGLARSMARTRKWGSEIGGNFLESDLEQLSWAGRRGKR